MIGWVQAIAFAAVLITVVAATASIIMDRMKYRHVEELKRIEQRQRELEAFDDGE